MQSLYAPLLRHRPFMLFCSLNSELLPVGFGHSGEAMHDKTYCTASSLAVIHHCNSN